MKHFFLVLLMAGRTLIRSALRPDYKDKTTVWQTAGASTLAPRLAVKEVRLLAYFVFCALISTYAQPGLKPVRGTDVVFLSPGVQANLAARLSLTEALFQQALTYAFSPRSRNEVPEGHLLANNIRNEVEELLAAWKGRKKEYLDIERLKRTAFILGSARIGRDDPAYREAEKLGRFLALAYSSSVITGGGPGIMEAGNKGAWDAITQVQELLSRRSLEGFWSLAGNVGLVSALRAALHAREIKSIGLNIRLPHEQTPNRFQHDESSLMFKYLFLRKMVFRIKSRGGFALKGGIGTLDEIFEYYNELPLVLINRDFSYEGLVDFLAAWQAEGLLEPTRPGYLEMRDSAEEALRHMRQFIEAKTQTPERSFREDMHDFIRELDTALLRLKNLGPAVSIFGGEGQHVSGSVWQTAHELSRRLIENGMSVINKENGNRGEEAGIANAVAAAWARNSETDLMQSTRPRGELVSLRLEDDSDSQERADRVVWFNYKEALRVALFRNTSKGFVIFEGGRDTLNILFEAWCLFKVDKAEPFPIILVGERWERMLMAWMRDEMAQRGTIQHEFLHDVQVIPVKSAQDAVFDVGATVDEIIIRLRVGNIACDLARDLREIGELWGEALPEKDARREASRMELRSVLAEWKIREHIFGLIQKGGATLNGIESIMEKRWKQKGGRPDKGLKAKLKGGELLDEIELAEWEAIVEDIAGIPRQSLDRYFARLRIPSLAERITGNDIITGFFDWNRGECEEMNKLQIFAKSKPWEDRLRDFFETLPREFHTPIGAIEARGEGWIAATGAVLREHHYSISSYEIKDTGGSWRSFLSKRDHEAYGFPHLLGSIFTPLINYIEWGMFDKAEIFFRDAYIILRAIEIESRQGKRLRDILTVIQSEQPQDMMLGIASSI